MNRYTVEQTLDINALKCPTYEPERLLAYIAGIVGAKTDKMLADAVGTNPSIICRLRHRKIGVSNTMLMRIHDATGVPIKKLKLVAGLPLFKPTMVSNRPVLKDYKTRKGVAHVV